MAVENTVRKRLFLCEISCTKTIIIRIQDTLGTTAREKIDSQMVAVGFRTV